ncbi:hypothetical protein GCM10009613_54650 [Pseudonocardia kongjuensis]|uniref:Uncharacterized protein n=1 Tax=Pseudonocardia kongjuensis TaxID=102227 RepID=A0ABP4IYJ4_9PSEU
MPSYAAMRFIAHPLGVESNVVCKSGGVWPGPGADVGGPRVHGWKLSELGRDLDQRLVDKNSDWIEITCCGSKSEALGFKWNGSAASERVEDRRGVAAGRIKYLLMKLSKQILIARILPSDHALDETMQALPLGGDICLAGESIWM